MNPTTIRIATLTLLAVLLGLGGRREAGATNPPICPTTGSNAFQISTPCTITSPGSYTLTADLAVTGSTNQGSICNQDGGTGVGICIACTGNVMCSSGSPASNTTINLGGYTIYAKGSGAADGVCTFFAGGITVENGMIDARTFGFSNAGVMADTANNRVERLQVNDAAGGVVLGNVGVVLDNVVAGTSTGNIGIECGTDCLVSHNVSSAASATNTKGILTGSGGIIEENTVMGNATGLSPGTSTGYGENVLDNASVSGGQSMGKNICAGVQC